jgi:tetratricopeptide (TPR) repeat protein
MSQDQALCFVLMPFGAKKDPATGAEINFDDIYEKAIRPAVEAANLEPIRADEERTGGIIHKPMFERLLLCEYAVADLTTSNPNVYYELGVRHAVRPATTVAIFADGRLPFDLNLLRALPYRLGDGGNFGAAEATELTEKLTKRLIELRTLSHEQSPVDSPLFQLLGEYRAPDIAHLKTDVFQERVQYSVKRKHQLAQAREMRETAAVETLEAELGDFEGVEIGVLVDLYLTWRSLSKWDKMVELYDRLPPALKRTIMIREQYGFALNRVGRRADALRVLEGVLEEQGPSSETLGLLGRIYKDQWMDSMKQGQERLAAGFLDKAIAAYTKGFETDSRDAFPGMNAVTLLDIKGDEKALERKSELLPVVRFAVSLRLGGAKPRYWDYATHLELDVLDNNEAEAFQFLSDALANVREPWEPATTANNLALIREGRRRRHIEQAWLDEIIGELKKRSEESAT